jgi:hypothetical protein
MSALAFWKRAAFLIIIFMLASGSISAQPIRIALLKYSGGGDWYANPTSLRNLIHFSNTELNTSIDKEVGTVEPGSTELFNYPFVHMTGHGNVIFSASDQINLRNYLLGGGFLHVDDNYGMDKYIRRELKKLFPDKDLIEIGFDHPIYHQKFNFDQGLPKVHEHDNKVPQGFALFHEGRMILFYSYEADLGDGWEDPEVHGDSFNTRTKALQMGANLISFVFNQ